MVDSMYALSMFWNYIVFFEAFEKMKYTMHLIAKNNQNLLLSLLDLIEDAFCLIVFKIFRDLNEKVLIFQYFKLFCNLKVT